MAVEEGLDVDDDLLAHIDPAFERGRSEMRQQHDLAGPRELDQFRIDGGLVLEHVEPGAGDVAGLDQTRQRVLVDHFAARGVDDIGFGADQLEPPRRKQRVGRPRVLVTVMRRCTAVATSILSTPLPELAMSLSRSPDWLSTARSM